MQTAMGPLNLMIAKAEEGGSWRLVVTITPRATVRAGDPVATALTRDDAEHLIHALRRGIAEIALLDGGPRPS